MATLKKRFPPGLDCKIVFDTTGFTRDSIDAVIHTLIEAMLLVALVVVIFLQTWRASVIPLLAVPVSLIGTFGAMAAVGFSLNNLSLFGLVLAIGIVVDDAIVVVENVERNIALGLSPRDATRKAMDEVSNAVVAVALVLAAVFIPTAFISGISGQFYRQFALTIAFSTLISAFNSLTLSPALCAILLQPHGQRNDAFSRLMDHTAGWFFSGIQSDVRARDASVHGAGATAHPGRGGRAGGVCGFDRLDLSGVPTSAVGVHSGGGQGLSGRAGDSAGFGFAGTDGRGGGPDCGHCEQGSRDQGDDRHHGAFGAEPEREAERGDDLCDFGRFKSRTARGLTAEKIANDLRQKLSGIQEGFTLVFAPPPVNGMGVVGGFKMELQDRGGVGLTRCRRRRFN